MKSNTVLLIYQFATTKTFLKNHLILCSVFVYYTHSMTLDCHFSLYWNYRLCLQLIN